MAPANTYEPDLFSGKVELPHSAPHEDDGDSTIRKNNEAFKTISETADMLELPQHVLRFWESKFSQIKPLKLRGGRRYYRPQDIETLFTIKHLLYKEGYTIKGAKRAITQAKKQKAENVTAAATATPKIAPVEETPLFQMPKTAGKAPKEPKTQAGNASPSAPDKEELQEIHSELLKLRRMLSELPSLKADA